MKATTSAWLLGMAAALTACGGGGGGGGSSSAVPTGGSATVPADGSSTPTPTPAPDATPSPTPTPATTSVTPVTDVPVPTYAADSVEAGVFRVLNDERSRCGFGKVAQNAKLDTAAAAHTAYLAARWNESLSSSGAMEDEGRSGYTGANPIERASRAGYAATVGEYRSYHAMGAAKDYSNALVRTMLASVYQQVGMLDGNRDVGASIGFATQLLPMAILTWVNGTPQGVPLQDNAEVITYPCEGSSGVQPYVYGESPDPFAGLGIALDRQVGQPIYVRAPAGQSLRLTSATVIDANGTSVPVALYHAEQDPQHQLTASQAFVVPRAPLAEASRYSVQVQGTSNGVPFSRQFSFSTLKF